MSLEMHTDVPTVEDSLTPRWLAEMKALGIDCEMHPGVSLVSHSGFLPFKIRIHDSAHEELNGIEFLTGFEYFIDEFSLDAELQKRAPRPVGLGRLFGRKPPVQPYATPSFDEKLKRCRKLLTFAWGSADLFELRMATVSSAVLADITGGVSSEDIWYDRPNAAVQALAEARDYENSLAGKDIQTDRFEGWD
jgi:hypothetical protein